ncbi:MAG: hypothetical protein ACREL6_09210, partial [Gemmatimonadales bacterium]
MRNLLPIFLLAATACDPAPPTYEMVPGQHVGPVTATSSWEDLQYVFPDSQVKRAEISLGEGFIQPGAVIWPDDPLRRFELVWADSAPGYTAMVILRGDSTKWHTHDGLTLGVSLAELERING